METIRAADARGRWSEVVSRVDDGEHIIITRYGDDLAVLLPSGWYREAVQALQLKAALDALADGLNSDQLREAMASIASPQNVTVPETRLTPAGRREWSAA
jgi:prevent-host-death family protein